MSAKVSRGEKRGAGKLKKVLKMFHNCFLAADTFKQGGAERMRTLDMKK